MLKQLQQKTKMKMTKQSKSKQLLEAENQRLSIDNNSIPEMKDELLEISSLMPD